MKIKWKLQKNMSRDVWSEEYTDVCEKSLVEWLGRSGVLTQKEVRLCLEMLRGEQRKS